MKVELLTESNVISMEAALQADLTPDDRFLAFARPVTEWLGRAALLNDRPNAIAEITDRRCKAYISAYDVFFNAAHAIYDNYDDLRHEPHVIESYDPSTDQMSYLFIFKAENNGNTYKVNVESTATEEF